MEKVQPVSRMMSTMSSEVLVRDKRVATKSGSKSARVKCELRAFGSSRVSSEIKRIEKSKLDAEGAKGIAVGGFCEMDSYLMGTY